ncbi:MAG: hypothetical protein WKF94_09275 [Solirubrobacteraceae bacterium]
MHGRKISDVEADAARRGLQGDDVHRGVNDVTLTTARRGSGVPSARSSCNSASTMRARPGSDPADSLQLFGRRRLLAGQRRIRLDGDQRLEHLVRGHRDKGVGLGRRVLSRSLKNA